jgi:hypothetical protein
MLLTGLSWIVLQYCLQWIDDNSYVEPQKLPSSNDLTVEESRYGLGLPLALRPKVNLNTYSTVSKDSGNNWNQRTDHLEGQFRWKALLHDGHTRLQNCSLSRLSAHSLARTTLVPPHRLDRAWCLCPRPSSRYLSPDIELQPRTFNFTLNRCFFTTSLTYPFAGQKIMASPYPRNLPCLRSNKLRPRKHHCRLRRAHLLPPHPLPHLPTN